MNEIAPVLWTQIWQVTAVAAIVFQAGSLSHLH